MYSTITADQALSKFNLKNVFNNHSRPPLAIINKESVDAVAQANSKFTNALLLQQV
jgi:hypothetical protein